MSEEGLRVVVVPLHVVAQTVRGLLLTIPVGTIIGPSSKEYGRTVWAFYYQHERESRYLDVVFYLTDFEVVAHTVPAEKSKAWFAEELERQGHITIDRTR